MTTLTIKKLTNNTAAVNGSVDLTPGLEISTYKITVDSVDYIVVEHNSVAIIKHGTHGMTKPPATEASVENATKTDTLSGR